MSRTPAQQGVIDVIGGIAAALPGKPPWKAVRTSWVKQLLDCAPLMAEADLSSYPETIVYEMQHRRWSSDRRLVWARSLYQRRRYLEGAWPMADETPALPFTLLWPVAAELKADNPFGANPELYAPLGYAGHPGVDFACTEGTPVRCCDDGTVAYAGSAGTAGNMVSVDHGAYRTRYLHLSEIHVSVSDYIARGGDIGLSGNTGFTEGPHLHLDFYPDGEPADNGYSGRVDPTPYLVRP